MTKQDYKTPPEFVGAIALRYGTPTFDLAATRGDQIGTATNYFSPEDDSLAQDWTLPGHRVVFLNPPFKHIRPWVAKLEAECRYLPRWTLCLVPASMGSKWWRDHVLHKCVAVGVTRMKFVGAKDAFMKDLSLLSYGYGVEGTGFWDWREYLDGVKA